MIHFFGSKQAEQQKTWEVLYKLHYDRVFRNTYFVIRDYQLTEDAVQEAFYRAFQRLDQLKQKEKFGSWVGVIAINIAKDYLQANNRYFPSDEVVLIGNKHTRQKGEIEFGLETVEKKNEVERILNNLSLDQREILLLKYYEELTIEEIAEMLNISPGTVKSRIHRAKQRFKHLANIDNALFQTFGGENK